MTYSAILKLIFDLLLEHRTIPDRITLACLENVIDLVLALRGARDIGDPRAVVAVVVGIGKITDHITHKVVTRLSHSLLALGDAACGVYVVQPINTIQHFVEGRRAPSLVCVVVVVIVGIANVADSTDLVNQCLACGGADFTVIHDVTHPLDG